MANDQIPELLALRPSLIIFGIRLARATNIPLPIR